MSIRTASIIIANDGILQNQKNDHVSKFLVQELNSLQYSVEKVVIVSEKVNVISNELEFMVKNSDVIIAVSPKCNTFNQAIGGIISQKLESSAELIEKLHEIKEPFEEDDVLIPIQAKILSGNVYPVIYFQRIFILKEKYYKGSFNKILKNHLLQYRKERKFEKIVRIVQNGNANFILEDLAELHNSPVHIEFKKDNKYFIFKISSGELSHIVEFEEKLKNIFGSYSLASVEVADTSWKNVYASNEEHIKNTIENIEECLEQCGPENIFISFNGGKDCTVLLHLILAVIRNKYPHYAQPIFCLYVQSSCPFPEQDEFITHCQEYYNLQIMSIRSGIKEALQQTLLKFPHYKACFMGTRRTDPFSKDLNIFQMTDPDWPQILRVSPLLDWHYSDIWDYLLLYKVPYCKLYDMGYTSLGNTINTTKNPSLLYYDHFNGKETYLPAYKLLKEVKERNGRNSS